MIPGRIILASRGVAPDLQMMAPDDEHPGLVKLDREIHREARTIYVPVPKANPRHDVYGPRPSDPENIADLIGREYFEPAVIKSAPVKRDKVRMYHGVELMRLLGGRTSNCLKNWMNPAIHYPTILPQSVHWTAGEVGVGRKRLYCQQQVDGLVAIAWSEGLIGNKSAKLVNFSLRAYDLWDELAAVCSMHGA